MRPIPITTARSQPANGPAWLSVGGPSGTRPRRDRSTKSKSSTDSQPSSPSPANPAGVGPTYLHKRGHSCLFLIIGDRPQRERFLGEMGSWWWLRGTGPARARRLGGRSRFRAAREGFGRSPPMLVSIQSRCCLKGAMSFGLIGSHNDTKEVPPMRVGWIEAMRQRRHLHRPRNYWFLNAMPVGSLSSHPRRLWNDHQSCSLGLRFSGAAWESANTNWMDPLCGA